MTCRAPCRNRFPDRSRRRSRDRRRGRYPLDFDSVDIRLPGGPQVEVKSAAYLQEWGQPKPSAITFSIAAAEGWDATTGAVDPARRRLADVYVFCLRTTGTKAPWIPSTSRAIVPLSVPSRGMWADAGGSSRVVTEAIRLVIIG
ncbi:hypothetical protein ACTVZO_03375 [Streptomyces sp. IBSNAI002]|uniref:hypothetical protein n=1 Tax=Streptomyces sp. IBSNAI002 TaxID=3457500 RepID=UPI003FD4C360